MSLLKSQKTALACAVGILAMVPLATQAQEIEPPQPIPDFLQGLPQDQLNSKPVQRFLFNYRLRANPDGSLPDAPGARLVPAIDALPTSPVTAFPYVLNSRWTSLGPQPVTGGQIGNTLTTRPMSGRVSSLAVHPTNNNRWLVGTANGGLWETKDGGTNFVALTDAAPSLAIGAVAYAPSSPNIIYLGTGEATFSGASFGGEGVLKSIDNGVNWQQLAVGTFFKGTAFSQIRVDPNNPNILVAATSLGIFGRSGGNVRPPGNGARGLWRSIDGGVSWTQTLTIDGISISPNPSNFMQQYAGLGFGANVTSIVKRSVDGGVTWTTVPGPWTSLSGTSDRTEVVVAPSNPNRVYAAVNNGATSGMFGLWTTTNAWDPTPTWTPISLTATDNGTGTLGPCAFDKAFNSTSAQCWYNMTLTVKPTNENMLFFGGIPVWRYDGTTWVEVSQTASPADRNLGIHVDQHASAWAGSRLIMGNDGGVWSTTTDGTGAWSVHNATLTTIQYYEGSAQPDASKLIGGSQDNGTHQRTASNAWPLIFGGDGAGNLSTSATNIGVSSQNQGVARSLNGGTSFTSVRGNYAGSAPFIGKMRECAGATTTVILNGSRVNRTTDFYTGTAASLWTANPTGGIFVGGVQGMGIAFGSNCNTFAMGSVNGQLMLSTTGGVLVADFRNLNNAAQIPARPIAAIAFDPISTTRMCVGYPGFTGGAPANIFCTANYTLATPVWTNVSVPVDVSIDSLVFDPTVANRLYAGSDFGVWVSSDAGATWAHWGPQVGMPNVPVYDLVARGGKLFAFTHGRGVFVLSNFDINNDAVVDCADVSIVKAAMGKKIGDVGFNVLADLNSDNAVNIRDLSMITRQLPGGTSCP